MTTKKPSHPSENEEEYFAREEALQLHRLARQKMDALQAQERAALQKLHFMKCPKCGFDLHTVLFKGVSIDKCFHCSGTWLDAGELETLAGKQADFLHQVLALFKRDE